MLLEVLDIGAPALSIAKWSELADLIMQKRDLYSNSYAELVIESYEGYIVGDINPSNGIFCDTPSLTRGEQLKALNTKMRSSFNGLLAKLAKSGFHSSHTDLIKAAYERTGESRTKDANLFFYYLVLRDKDLEFMESVLMEDENGDDAIKEEPQSSETEYSRRKKSAREREEKQRNIFSEKQIGLFRSIMSPDSASTDGNSTASLNDSMIAKNYATSETEKAKTTSLEVERLTSQLTHPQRDDIYTAEDIALLKQKLRRLMQL
jgi:hypothetical protein